jgi:hypothetical protein
LFGEPQIRGYGQSDTILLNTLRAINPWSLQWDTMEPADREILTNQMQLSLVPTNLAAHAVAMDATATPGVDQALLGTLQLTPQQHERYAVLAGGNRAEAQKLGLQLPDQALVLPTRAVGTIAGAQPPAEALDLREALNWLVGTDGYLRESPGLGGGRESVVKSVIHAYREQGMQLLLAQDPALQRQYQQTQIQHALTKMRPEQRDAMQGRLQDLTGRSAEQARTFLGLSPQEAGRSAAPTAPPVQALTPDEIRQHLGIDVGR